MKKLSPIPSAKKLEPLKRPPRLPSVPNFAKPLKRNGVLKDSLSKERALSGSMP